MLNHLRQHIAATLEKARSATLATSGPAGLQAQVLPCAACGIQLYLLLPATSDQLLNLEHDPTVVVTTAEWQVRGRARVGAEASCAAAMTLLEAPDAPWSVVVAVQPTRVSIAQREGWGAAETIDLE
jgi:Pyridoxamine 5'-phosphate oxidase